MACARATSPPSASSRSSTARASRSSTRAAASRRPRRAATAPRARRSRPTSARSAAFPRGSRITGKLTLRGEVLIYRKDLETLNAEREAAGLEVFANPRNAAAGAVRMMDPREVAKRPLRAIFYQAVEGPR